MYSLGLLAFSSFLLALFMTPLVRNLARRYGVMDRSRSERRLHADPIPRLGGIAMVLAYLGAFAILLLLDLEGGRLISEGLSVVMRLMPAAALIFAIGILDDLRGLSPLQKFAGQLFNTCPRRARPRGLVVSGAISSTCAAPTSPPILRFETVPLVFECNRGGCVRISGRIAYGFSDSLFIGAHCLTHFLSLVDQRSTFPNPPR